MVVLQKENQTEKEIVEEEEGEETEIKTLENV